MCARCCRTVLLPSGLEISESPAVALETQLTQRSGALLALDLVGGVLLLRFGGNQVGVRVAGMQSCCIGENPGLAKHLQENRKVVKHDKE